MPLHGQTSVKSIVVSFQGDDPSEAIDTANVQALIDAANNVDKEVNTDDIVARADSVKSIVVSFQGDIIQVKL